MGLDFWDILKVIGYAALPIFELRGAIPIAIIVHDFPWYYAYIFAVIGNLLPVPFILLFLDFATRILGKIKLFERFFSWLFEKVRQRGKRVERFERIGLALFVAIPLPVTGAWTGSILAVLMGMKFKYAFVSILVGVLVAGVVVTCATVLGWSIADIFTKPVD
jgi:uncharacterized membrane protein